MFFSKPTIAYFSFASKVFIVVCHDLAEDGIP